LALRCCSDHDRGGDSAASCTCGPPGRDSGRGSRANHPWLTLAPTSFPAACLLRWDRLQFGGPACEIGRPASYDRLNGTRVFLRQAALSRIGVKQP